jgi:hypothetical protein
MTIEGTVLERSAYEGVGGWNDGRLGQAYDLIWSVLKQARADASRHPILAEIESIDQSLKDQSHD